MNVLVAGDGRYSFRHALLGEAVYDDLLPGERVRLHAAVRRRAAPRAAAPGTAAELARHARLANDLDTALTASDPGRRRGRRRRRARRGGPALPAGARAARGPGPPASGTTGDVSKLAVARRRRAVDQLRPARSAPRSCSPSSSAQLPDDAPAYAGVRGCCRPAPTRCSSPSPRRTRSASRSRPSTCSRTTWAGCGPRCSSVHARMLSGYGQVRRGAGRRPRRARASPSGSTCTSSPPTSITTLVRAQEGRPEGGAAQRAGRRGRAGGREPGPCTPRCGPASSGPLLPGLGRVRRRRALVPQRHATAPSRPGIPWAPYGFEGRWQLAWVKYVQGDWDAGPRADRRHRRARAADRRRAARQRAAAGASRPAASDVADRARALRRFWEREGCGRDPRRRRSSSPRPARADDPHAVRRRLPRRRRRPRPDLARVVQRPDPARRHHGRPRSRTGCRKLSAAERAAYLEEVDRLHEDGHTVLQKYADPSGHWGPEGRAWVKRLDAETLRARWLAGTDAPPQEALVETWRDAEQLFADFGHVHELAAVRADAGRHPARHRRPGRRPRGRRPGPRGRAPAGRPAAARRARATLGSAPGRAATPPRTRSPRGRPRSSRWSPRAAPTARSASSCSSAPRPSRCTSPTSSASSAPPAAPRPPPSPGAGACSTDRRRLVRAGVPCAAMIARWVPDGAPRPTHRPRRTA